MASANLCTGASIFAFSVAVHLHGPFSLLKQRIKHFFLGSGGDPDEMKNAEMKKSTKPNEENKEISCSNCSGTVKPYDVHIIVSDLSEWARQIDLNPDSHVYRIQKALNEQSLLLKEKRIRVKLTACDYSSSSTDSISDLQAIVYPEGSLFNFPTTDENFENFAKYIFNDKTQILPSISRSRVPWKKVLLVCTHNSRDKRCGQAGPEIIKSFKNVLSDMKVPEDDICVLGSSHIGGHEYAGTLILYPEGDWYGHINGGHVRELITNILAGVKMERCLRGSNTNW